MLLQVQNLIERCLQLYMNRGEVVMTLSTRARIEPGFTTLGKVFMLSLSCDSFANNSVLLSLITQRDLLSNNLLREF